MNALSSAILKILFEYRPDHQKGQIFSLPCTVFVLSCILVFFFVIDKIRPNSAKIASTTYCHIVHNKHYFLLKIRILISQMCELVIHKVCQSYV